MKKSNTININHIDLFISILLTIVLLFNQNHFASVSLAKYVLKTIQYVVSVGSAASFPDLITNVEITGSLSAGQVLSASLTPPNVTADYRWQICDTKDGDYTDILGATSSDYTPSVEDIGKYIRVIATGTGLYYGRATSSAKGPIGAYIITGISDIIGTAAVGEVLTAGQLDPVGATADYQWQKSDPSGAVFTDISGATGNTYIVSAQDLSLYIRVKASGTGLYSGIVISRPTASRVGNSSDIITGIEISGTPQVGQTLTADALTPLGSTATYQWQRSDNENGIYTDIPGATSDTYTLTTDDYKKYIRVVATGSGLYTGTAISAPTAPVSEGIITALSDIIGPTVVEQTVMAGALTPHNATVTYQWYRCAQTSGTYEPIPGATGRTYTLTQADNGYYIKVTATGYGCFTGFATSSYAGPVDTQTVSIIDIGAINGIFQVGQVLAAGSLSPSQATATYKWQRSDTINGAYTDIAGATSATYKLTANDYDKYIRVIATGSGLTQGYVVSQPVGPIGKAYINSISDIIGTCKVGQVLTAGDVNPIGATVTYQWQRCDSGGSYYNIPGATSKTYYLTEQDSNCFIRVIATATGAYSGTVISVSTTSIVAEWMSLVPVTNISISGSPRVGSTLTAGSLMPIGATATYQWQRSMTIDGPYSPIPNSRFSTYTLTADDYNHYIRVVAIGSGLYTGYATSEATSLVQSCPITAINEISGSTVTGQTLTAGTITPYGATVNYQWKRAETAGGTYVDIPNANSDKYTLTQADVGFYIKVVATGTGAYTGTAPSPYAGPVVLQTTPVTAINAIKGTAQVGQRLIAGDLTPYGATTTYRWQKCSAIDGTYADIYGATSITYTLKPEDYGYYIRVVATGTGSYTGVAASAPIGAVSACPVTSISEIVGTTTVGHALTAGTVTPVEASVEYTWQRYDASTGSYVDITGATSKHYTILEADIGTTIRVVVKGTGSYSGVVTSAPTAIISDSAPTAVTKIEPISGTAQTGMALTAGALTPANATVTYQWQRCSTPDGIYTPIPGASSQTYTLTLDDYDKYIRVVATGSGNFSGTVISDCVGKVTGEVVLNPDPDDNKNITESTVIGDFVAKDATIINSSEAPINIIEVTMNYTVRNASGGDVFIIISYPGTTEPVCVPLRKSKGSWSEVFTLQIFPAIPNMDSFSIEFSTNAAPGQLDKIIIDSVYFKVLA
ncbi:MAG: hypothetical protein PHX02_06425 [Oscillospiraceae bacterium]|nr:hypothetical protein [Oscillospiraceae bacterium]